MTTERTHDIAVCVALGARRRDVLHAVLGPVSRVVVIGVTFGLLALTGVAALLAFIALVASYMPTRRVLRVDPLVALRRE